MTESDAAARVAREALDVFDAVHLNGQGVVSLGRAARIAGLSAAEFIDRLGAPRIPVARSSSDELSREVAEFG